MSKPIVISTETHGDDVVKPSKPWSAPAGYSSAREVAPIAVALPSYDRDTHEHHAHVDNRARTVVCGTCGVPMDPIAALYRVACEASWVASLRRDRADLEREIAGLKVEVSNLKAAKKRASR